MNVLLSAVGRRAYLVNYFKEVVHPLGGKVFATNTHAGATGFLEADQSWVVPPSASTEEFIEVMVRLCRENQIRLLFSLHDWEAPVIAAHRQRFLDVGTIPVMGSAEVLSVCLDKYRTVCQAKELGVPVPQTFLSLEEVEAALQGGLSFPLVVKPRWGQGSVGLFQVHAPEELRAAYQLSRIQAERFAKICPGVDPDQPQVLIQAFIPGEEYGCDIVNDLDGKFRRAFVKRKFDMRSGETDIAESVSRPDIEALGETIAKWSRHLGCMDSDFIVSEAGIPYLIELNPRFGGGYPFTHCAGANIPQACVRWASGDPDPDNTWCSRYRTGVRTYKEIALYTQDQATC